MGKRLSILLLLAILGGLVAAGCDQGPRPLHLGGGPAGGTFQVVAEGLAEVLRRQHAGSRIQIERSAGSFANLQALERGELDLALVYGGDLGSRSGPAGSGDQARLLCRLYGAAAQLAVLASSNITLPSQLRGARVAIGSSGSGAAQVAERYFRATGIWDRIIPVYIGYEMATNELLRGNVTAVWEMVGVPSPSLVQASRRVPLRLINLQETGRHGNFFALHPYYRPVSIAAGTYPGQEQPVATFEDTALLAAAPELAPPAVKDVLAALFGDAGLAQLRGVHPVLGDFGPDQALRDLPAPLHPGAVIFWRERGRELPPDLLPVADPPPN